LASARRKPPVALLDSVSPFNYPPLTANEKLIQTVIQGRVYELDRSSSEWKEIANTINYGNRARWQATSHGALAHLYAAYKWHRVIHYPLGRTPEVLFQN